MKTRITAKFLVIAALLVLVINVCSSFGSLFIKAQTTSTGYNINVTYKDGTAILTGNSKDVLQGCKLTTLTDDSTGQQYDPNTFSMQVSKNGTYTFTLGYTLNGISEQAQSEKIAVVVDKLSTGDAHKTASTGVMAVSTLESRATATNQDIPMKLYAYENYDINVGEIDKTPINVPSGVFSEHIDQINNLIKQKEPNREFMTATLYRAADDSEITINGVWKVGDNYYYSIMPSVAQKENGSISIAYQAGKNDELRIYCKLSNPKMASIDLSSLNSDLLKGMEYNISPNPQQSDPKGTIAVGSTVVIAFTWPNSVDDVTLSIDGVTIDKVEKDKFTRKYKCTFTMPDKDIVVKAKIDKKEGVRWLGVYNAATTNYQGGEIGWTSIGSETNAPTGAQHANKAWSSVEVNYGVDKFGNAIYPIVNNFQKYYELTGKNVQYTYAYAHNGSLKQGGDSQTGYLSAKDSQTIQYPGFCCKVLNLLSNKVE